MKFEIKNRFTGEVQVVADIKCDEGASYSFKLGLAVKWALENSANLRGANLRDANLRGANLWDADLRDANLWGANLWGADLWGANLRGADLWGANLRDADLRDADLWGANLRDADLRDANLWGANLRYADLRDADLWGADLRDATGVNDWVKCIQIETYPITYTSEILQIGCERHPIQKWRDFDDHRILEMDGKTALKFWRKYKDWIFLTIDLCPAKPTKGTE